MALWTPTQITTALWLDASDSGTITHASGAVSQWDDKSGNGYAFTQSTASLKPATGSTSQNGLNTLSFSSDYLTSTAAASVWKFLHDGTKVRLYGVVKAGNVTSPNAGYGFLGTNGGSLANVGFCLFYDDRSADSRNNGINTYVSKGGGAGVWDVVDDYSGNDFLTANAYTLYAAYLDPSNATAALRSSHVLNDDNTASNNASSNAPSTSNPTYTLQLGTTGNAVVPLTGQIGELVIVTGDVPGSDDDKVWGYLAHKWGLTAGLPVGHPYKDTAPDTNEGASAATSSAQAVGVTIFGAVGASAGVASSFVIGTEAGYSSALYTVSTGATGGAQGLATTYGEGAGAAAATASSSTLGGAVLPSTAAASATATSTASSAVVLPGYGAATAASSVTGAAVWIHAAYGNGVMQWYDQSEALGVSEVVGGVYVTSADAWCDVAYNGLCVAYGVNDAPVAAVASAAADSTMAGYGALRGDSTFVLMATSNAAGVGTGNSTAESIYSVMTKIHARAYSADGRDNKFTVAAGATVSGVGERVVSPYAVEAYFESDSLAAAYGVAATTSEAVFSSTGSSLAYSFRGEPYDMSVVGLVSVTTSDKHVYVLTEG